VKPGIQAGFYEGDAEYISGTAAASVGGPGVNPSGTLVSYAGYKFDSAIIDKVKYLDTNFNLNVSGGYRDPQKNASVNGSTTSYHLSGRAVDMTGSAAEMEKGRKWAVANGAKEARVHNAGSGVHLHAAW
jgi:hypothetical protein